jgi:polyhydroxyalkanoate synthesis regulator phasin
MAVISRDRIEEVLGEAVERGRVTAEDAQGIASNLVQRGRKQTSDVLKDLEQLMGRGRDEIGGARKGATEAARQARRRVSGARGKAARAASPALEQADRLRRAAGGFPISAYESLTASQVQSRLAGLTPAQLRKVRDYERRHGNRKTVLKAIETRLA